MKLAIKALTLALFATLGLSSVPGALGALPIPAAPSGYILDQPQVLEAGTLRGVGNLLSEHERITGEQLVVAILKSLDDEDLVDYTTRVFQEWRIGQRNKNNGVLLALYWDDRKIRIEVGYGLEPLLTDAKSRQVIEESLSPNLKAGQPDLAIQSAVLQILEILESPLIANNQARTLLAAAQQQAHRARPDVLPKSRFLNFLFLLGIFLVLYVLDRLRNPETLYTRAGWSRMPHSRRPHIFLGGSGGGGFGGGGLGSGFGGGGGRSGGGGANGSW